ncbi:SLOG family protein [Oscillospiraceae bacterium LCP25S3_E10]
MTQQEMNLHRCCFTGHRPEKLFLVDKEIIRELEREIELAIDNGFTTFITGMARGVDIWAAEIVLKLRKKNKELHLICASPYEGFETRWSREWQKRYKNVMEKADLVKYISDKYTPSCFRIRNEWMVNHSNRVISVYNGKAGGTRNTISYAKAKHVPVFIIEG